MKKFILFSFLLASSLACEKERMLEPAKISENMPGKFIGDMALDSGNNLWLITSEVDTTIEVPAYSSYLPIRAYLSKYNDNKYEIIDDRFPGALKMIFDNKDRLWMLKSKSLTYMDKNKYTKVYNLPEDTGLFEWMAKDNDDNIWIGGLSAPLLKVTTDPEVIAEEIGRSVLPTLSSTAGCFDSNNNLWLTLWDNGIGRRDESGNWTIYNASDSSLPTYQNLWCIVSDKDDNIWAGTGWNDNSVNLLKFDGLTWQAVTASDDRGNLITGTVRKLYADDSRIWIVSEKAVNNAFDSNILITYDGVSWNRIYSIPADDGIADIEIDVNGKKAWIGTWNKGCFELNLE